MSNIVAVNGKATVTIPSGESIAVFTQGEAQVSRTIGFPNYPDQTTLIGTVKNGQTVFGSYSAGATIVVESTGSQPVYYEVGSAPQVQQLRLNSQVQGAPTDIADGGSMAFTAASLLSGIVTATPTAGRNIQRAEDIATQATEGQRAFDLLLKDHFFKFQLPNMLNVATTSINKVLDVLSGKIGKKSMDELVNASKTAKSFDELLKTLPASERSKFLKALKDPSTFAQPGKLASKVSGAASLGAESATNALAPESQNQNALSR